MKRAHQVVLIVSFVPLCWFGMMAVHELGHVVAAWMTGGSVTKVVLSTTSISRTDVSPNPNPLFVVWSGPLIGVIMPLMGWVLAAAWKVRGSYLIRFFAGFCLVANGAYIAVGSFNHIGDAGEIIRLGTVRPVLWLFGLATIPSGFWLWHGLGPNFGFGPSNGRVEAWAAYLSLCLLGLTLIVMTTCFADS